jgi:hypothetical protein
MRVGQSERLPIMIATGALAALASAMAAPKGTGKPGV